MRETVQEARGWPRDGPGRVGLGTLLCTVGPKRRREGKECFAEIEQGVRPNAFRDEEPESAAGKRMPPFLWDAHFFCQPRRMFQGLAF